MTAPVTPIKARWMDAVIAAPIDGATAATIAVAAVLASHMNRQGCCWPSEATIATEARCTDRTVRRAVTRLESAGLVAVVRRLGASNTYRALSTTPDIVSGVVDQQPRTNDTQTPDIMSAESLEPVNDARARAREAGTDGADLWDIGRDDAGRLVARPRLASTS